MTLRFTCFDLLVTIWLLLIKDTFCFALELQRYPDGVTSIYAIEKCGTAGLENDPLVLNKISELNDKEFWTGLAVYTLLTPWIETLGCYLLRMQPGTASHVPSVGLCQHECSTAYFSYNKADNTCSCLNLTDIQLDNRANPSSCLRTSANTVLVYKMYTGKIITDRTKHGLCTTLTCTPPDAEDLRSAICTGSGSNIKSLCEDGQPLTSHSWSLSQNEALAHCWNKSKLLLHSNACKFFSLSLTAPAWTNVFREEIEVELPLGKGSAVPTFCLSAKISEKGGHVLDKNRRNCSTKLEWFVCKNDSITVESTYRTDEAPDSNYGAIVGGSVGVVIILLIGVTITLCKLRRVGIFKNNNSMKSTNVSFTKSLSGEATREQHVNQGNALVFQGKEQNNKTKDTYAQVQKVKCVEDNYTESSNREYDHLHNIGGRNLNAGENTYDSNTGVRNHNDPTYDTAITSTRVNMDSTYDHSFTNMKTYSEYDVSDSGMQIERTNYDAYDQAC